MNEKSHDKFAAYFKGKKITLMRIGLLGRGVGDAAFLAEMGAVVHVVDDAPQDVMQQSADALRGYPNITFSFGAYNTDDFVHCDFVLVGAGSSLFSPELHAAREAGVPLKQSAALFAELSGVPVIGVTGTRGKSTVTHMIHHVLSHTTGEKVLLGGNIRGVSNLQLLKEVKDDSLAVMELDSWQLQGFGWAEISPHVAVFTNFMEDHLNYYGADGCSKEEAMERYFNDKANIFRYQEESGVLVTVPEVFERTKTLKGVTLGQEVVLVDSSVIPEDALLSMPGEHNRLNAALAYEALKATGLSEEEIFEGFASFPGVPGRLEHLGEREGVKIYNDNNATTPQATIEGLRALGDEESKNIVLIMGGAYKEVDPTPLIPEMEKYCKKVLLLPGTGSERLLEKIQNLSVNRKVLAEVSDLKEGVEAALRAASSGDTILFSPAFASFGQFKNEYERNDLFVQLIKSIDEVPE